MKFTLEMTCNNADYSKQSRETEIARILSVFAAKIEELEIETFPHAFLLHDSYGNLVGQAQMDELVTK